MCFTKNEFENLPKKHGKYASLAIWEHSKERTEEKSIDTIYENLNILNNRYVLIGLNISKPVETWENFRGGTHDRKLKYAFNDSPLRGSYITDLFKNIINPSSVNFSEFIKDKPDVIEKNVLNFVQEMNDLKVSAEISFVVLGTKESITAKLFKKYFQQNFPDNNIFYHRHYSCRGYDREWVESIWKTLNIDLNFDSVLANYQ